MTPNKGGRKYAMKGKNDKDVYLQAITMIDPATGWIEIRYRHNCYLVGMRSLISTNKPTGN